jgi:hypothetical protein
MMRSEAMPEEIPTLPPTPTQAESDAMVLAATGGAMPLGQPLIGLREGEDLTPAMTQAQNDMAVLIACGPPPGSLAPMVVDVPYVGGSATVGGTLTCTMGNWTGEPTEYAYQWRRDGTGMGSGTAAYLVVAADAGHDIDCVVTATNGNGATVAPPSNAVLIGAAATASAAAPVHSRR